MNPGVNPATDHTTPDRGLPFPIVAIGASAGGIEASTALLKALAPDTGMAFIVVQHLSPTHESRLAEILARTTRMAVSEVTDNTPVAPNHVYVIPPNKQLVFGNGELRLAPRSEIRGQPRPIDHFMRSLAEEQGHKAIGIVLSGTANDGTLGLEEIKAGGGITFAQDATAEQSSMPRSAIAAGAVDFVLPPHEIARELERIAHDPYVRSENPAVDEPTLRRVVESLQQRTGVDFAHYKRNTLHRRITRRMVLRKLNSLRDYLRMLQTKPEELEALYLDVLINVTSFFRNPEAYEALKESVFPKLTEGRGSHDPLRVWALGCSTGEEAYSVAMVFTEYLESSGRHVPMQIFATDLNAFGIDKARAGFYPRGITQDVSPARLRRFFDEVDGGYRVSKQIREMCVFARQNALTDPPFSRIDLVACRNLLIYLEPVLQQRLIPLLHYALRPGGYLWLGRSETVGAHRDLYEVVDSRNKIYLRRAGKRGAGPHIPTAIAERASQADDASQEVTLGRAYGGPDPQKAADRALLSRYVPPGVLVNDELEVLQFRGDTGAYLAPAPGRATLSLLKMLREGLLVPVRAALERAKRGEEAVRQEGLRVRSNGGWREVDVVVLPVRGGHEGAVYAVVFEEPADRAEARARELAAEARAAAERMPRSGKRDRDEINRLTQELSATREYLQSVIEQQEAANEGLQSANEEVQSANEELQSINEELETSKEEVQSANEELATVNDELQNRNSELWRSNSDLTNLFSSVNMAIVMLGPDLRVRRFTQPAEKLLNLIDADVGRPLRELNLNIDVPRLDELAAEVIEKVEIREREVQDRNDRWYSLRIRPYRTLENKIDGAVLILVDIDDLKRAEHVIRESEQRFEMLADCAAVLIWVNDLDGCRFVNRAFEDFVGEPERKIRDLGPAAFVHPDEQQAYLGTYHDALRAKRRFEARARLRRADGTYRWMKVIAMPSSDTDGRVLGFVGCSFDITDMAEAESALMELDRGRNEFLAMLAHELRNPLSGVRNAARLLTDSSEAQVVAQARDIIDRQTTQMVRMIDDLLDVSRIAYGKIRLESELMDVVEVLRRAVGATARERELAKQSIDVDLPEDPIFVKGDPIRLEQVFGNLLGNASKFTRIGGRIWLAAEKEAATRHAPQRVVIRVRDNGSGIDPAVLPYIFDLFVQADRIIDQARTGIGVGLTLVKRFVDLHGGSIEARSAGQSQGSEFVVRLPIAAPPQAPKADSKPSAATARPARKRILVVDDDADSGESLRMILAAKGHEVRVAREGGAALAAAAELGAEVVLLDIGLPDIDGYLVARRLREDSRTRDALIVAVTGFSRDAERLRERDAGVDAHLTKPVDVDSLLHLIATDLS